jgi:lambda family phage portal protein
MPGLLHRLATAAGFVPAAAARAQAEAAALAAGRRVAQNAAAHQRSLVSALTTPDVATWQEDGTHINADTAAGLVAARSRSRGAARNNEHARRFLGMLVNNVLGPYGVRMQARVRTAGGTLRRSDNDRIEAGHAAFGRRGAFDVSGRHSRRQLERLALRHTAVDGECFIRERLGRGPHGVQVQLLTADVCPLTTTADLGGGRRIRQGVEIDADGAPVAYWFRTDDVTLDVAAILGVSSTHKLERVPADQVLHVYLPEEAGQLRGVPWMQAALKPMYQAADFAGAGLNKARESAKRGGFIQPHLEAPPSEGDEGSDGSKAADTLLDGTWERLLPGETVSPFESDYPNIEYGQFIKDCRRSIACALGVAYPTFGNDLEAVNYSSGQLGLEDERTLWQRLQEWWIDDVHRWIDRRWLRVAMLAADELQGLNFDRLESYLGAMRYLPHRWRPLDPLKTTEAERSSIEGRLTSPQRVIAARGDDPDEIVAELLEWQEKTAALGPIAPLDGAASGAQPDDAGPAAARAALRLRLIANRSDE